MCRMRRWRLNTSHELANVLVLHRHGHGTQRSLSHVLYSDNNPELKEISFGQNSVAQKRLEADLMAFCFMSSVYFSESEMEYLLEFPTACGLSCRQY